MGGIVICIIHYSLSFITIIVIVICIVLPRAALGEGRAGLPQYDGRRCLRLRGKPQPGPASSVWNIFVFIINGNGTSFTPKGAYEHIYGGCSIT